MRRTRLKKVVAAIAAGAAVTACAPVFSQNIGPAYGIRAGASAEEVRQRLGEPASAVSIDGIEEWRYCSSNIGSHDEFAVVYFQGEFVVEKAFYTLEPNLTFGGREPCLTNVDRLYTDKREPPRRVRELRARLRK